MNTVALTGHLATDLEVKTLQNEKGTKVLEARLAVPGRSKDAPATFIDIKAFNGAAETLAKHTGKGQRIGITGRIDVDQWRDAAEKPHSRTWVIVDEFEFLDGKRTEAAE